MVVTPVDIKLPAPTKAWPIEFPDNELKLERLDIISMPPPPPLKPLAALAMPEAPIDATPAIRMMNGLAASNAISERMSLTIAFALSTRFLNTLSPPSNISRKVALNEVDIPLAISSNFCCEAVAF